MKLKVQVSGYSVIDGALHNAIQSGMNKVDKYLEEQLSMRQRALLAEHIENYFWVEMDEHNVEIV